MPITATRALFIKLGEGNRWAQIAFDNGILPIGFREVSPDQARAAVDANDFTSVKRIYKTLSFAPGTATRYANEVREFYTADASVIWITFVQGRMWWCKADRKVHEKRRGRRAEDWRAFP